MNRNFDTCLCIASVEAFARAVEDWQRGACARAGGYLSMSSCSRFAILHRGLVDPRPLPAGPDLRGGARVAGGLVMVRPKAAGTKIQSAQVE